MQVKLKGPLGGTIKVGAGVLRHHRCRWGHCWHSSRGSTSLARLQNTCSRQRTLHGSTPPECSHGLPGRLSFPLLSPHILRFLSSFLFLTHPLKQTLCYHWTDRSYERTKYNDLQNCCHSSAGTKIIATDSAKRYIYGSFERKPQRHLVGKLFSTIVETMKVAN